MDVDERDPRLVAILAYAAPIKRGTVVLSRLSELSRSDVPSGGARLLGIAATAVGAFELASRFLDSSMADLRIQGRLGLLARALTLRAWTAAHRVDLNVGIPAAEEAVRLAGETSQPLIMATAQATQAMLTGLSGDRDATELLAAQVERVCVPIGASAALAAAQIARGQAALGAQRYREAFEHLKRLYDPSDLAYHGGIRCFAIADLAEAALHSGQPEEARAYVAQMEALAAETASPALHAGVSYTRALVADKAEAEPAFDAALASAPAASRFLHARAQLAYGEWLHQGRRSAESRAPLRTARDTFDALGTTQWGERARQQLRASGETSRRRGPEARDELTPQELQIARLAAEGLTNREIGQMLYLSPRTISSHLYRVFPKLGITSRTKLRDALQEMGT
jgi:DNA-binding CsgD family transcriptional regulator